MGSVAVPASLPEFFGNAFRQWLTLERFSVIRRCAIRNVGIPQVDVEKPAVARAVFSQPVKGQRYNLIGPLHSFKSAVVHLIDAGVPVPRGVPLGEAADRDGRKAH